MERRLTLTVLALAALMTNPTPASAAGRTSFKAETPPLPRATMTGEWTSTGESARLRFEGAHVVGDHTTFDARWTTSWTNTRKSPYIVAEIGFESLDPVGEQVAIGFLVRHQSKNRGWSRWIGNERELESDQGPSIYGGSHAGGLLLSRPVRVRFQVKIIGRLDGPGTLTGDVQLFLKDPI
jgi:hypothetical protein